MCLIRVAAENGFVRGPQRFAEVTGLIVASIRHADHRCALEVYRLRCCSTWASRFSTIRLLPRGHNALGKISSIKYVCCQGARTPLGEPKRTRYVSYAISIRIGRPPSRSNSSSCSSSTPEARVVKTTSKAVSRGRRDNKLLRSQQIPQSLSYLPR